MFRGVDDGLSLRIVERQYFDVLNRVASAFVGDAERTTPSNVPANMSLPDTAGWLIWTWRSSSIG
jgi:hypothetical protein